MAIGSSIDRQLLRRTARRVANDYVNSTIDRATCIRRLHQAAAAAGVTGTRPTGRAEHVLLALAHGLGDIEPGLFPRHLDRIPSDVSDDEYAARLTDLLHRLRGQPT
jgi:hypothetical protein